jgi:Rap1a immunity proteins
MPEFGPPISCFITGSDLLADLDISDDAEECWACRSHALGYISAVIDAHQTFHAAEGFAPVFAFPQISAGELNRLIADKLKQEPDYLDANAASLVVRILQAEFPPKTKGESKQ